MKSLARFAILLAGLPMASAHASDFDGSKRLICAPVIAMDCLSDGKCSRELPAEIGAPAFMRIDFAKKVVVGQKRTTPIMHSDKSDQQLMLQGVEMGLAWTIVIDTTDGAMMVSMVDSGGAYVLSGSCTPL
jgi:hypothetical protein